MRVSAFALKAASEILIRREPSLRYDADYVGCYGDGNFKLYKNVSENLARCLTSHWNTKVLLLSPLLERWQYAQFFLVLTFVCEGINFRNNGESYHCGTKFVCTWWVFFVRPTAQQGGGTLIAQEKK